MGSCRRHAIALAALALPLVMAPLGLALERGGEQKLEGTLRTWHGDTFRTPTSVGAGIDTADGLVPLAAAGPAVHALAGKKVRARGQRQGDVFAAGGDVQAASDETAVAATGSKSVAVLLFNFPNNTSQPWTRESVRSVVFDSASSVNAYYQDASYGQLSLTGDVFGWFTIDSTNDGCRYTTWANEARAKAAAAAVPLSSYQYVVYAFPQASSCNWAGLAYLPGTASWINGAMNLRVVGHELGHNFGVHHASTLSCTSGSVRTTFSGTCTQSEYGDPFTVMGSASTRHHVNWHRAQLGWFGDVQTATTSGSYTLAAAELTGTPRLLRVARGDGTYLNLEYRRPWGTFDNFPATDPVVNGVSIRIAPGTSSLVQSKLVDATPSTTSFTDAALAAGRTVVDPVSGVSITTVSVGPSSAIVSISFAPDSQAPTGPSSLSATSPSPTSVQLSWPAATDNVAVAGYRVYRGTTQIATTTALSYLDSGRSPETTYTYGVEAFDAAGNTGARVSASVTTQKASNGDTSPPTTPSGLAANVQKGRKVGLTWSPSSDNVSVVAYDVFRNGSLVASSSSPTYLDRPGRGTFTYFVRARDAAGNVSGNSPSVTVSPADD